MLIGLPLHRASMLEVLRLSARLPKAGRKNFGTGKSYPWFNTLLCLFHFKLAGAVLLIIPESGHVGSRFLPMPIDGRRVATSEPCAMGSSSRQAERSAPRGVDRAPGRHGAAWRHASAYRALILISSAPDLPRRREAFELGARHTAGNSRDAASYLPSDPRALAASIPRRPRTPQPRGQAAAVTRGSGSSLARRARHAHWSPA